MFGMLKKKVQKINIKKLHPNLWLFKNGKNQSIQKIYAARIFVDFH